MEGKAKEEELRQTITQVLSPFHEDLARRLSELEHSALYSCIPHCFRSFYEIYYKIIPALLQTPINDYDKLHDLFHDIGGLGGALQYIKMHITDAEAGFRALLCLLAEKAEQKEKEEKIHG